MPKAKKPTKKQIEASVFYKSYDINWLREETTHPDYHLVAEYDKKGNK